MKTTGDDSAEIWPEDNPGYEILSILKLMDVSRGGIAPD